MGDFYFGFSLLFLLHAVPKPTCDSGLLYIYYIPNVRSGERTSVSFFRREENNFLTTFSSSVLDRMSNLECKYFVPWRFLEIITDIAEVLKHVTKYHILPYVRVITHFFAYSLHNSVNTYRQLKCKTCCENRAVINISLKRTRVDQRTWQHADEY